MTTGVGRGHSRRVSRYSETVLAGSPTALASLPVKTAYLDGEVAILGRDGVTSFAALQDALSKGLAADLVYFAFDLLHLDGLDLTPLQLIERKATLKKTAKRKFRQCLATPTPERSAKYRPRTGAGGRRLAACWSGRW